MKDIYEALPPDLAERLKEAMDIAAATLREEAAKLDMDEEDFAADVLLKRLGSLEDVAEMMEMYDSALEAASLLMLDDVATMRKAKLLQTFRR